MKSALIENGEGAFLFIASVNHFRIKRRLFIWWRYLNVWNWIFHTWNFLSLDSKKAYWSNIAKEKRLFSWIVPPVFEMPLFRKKRRLFTVSHPMTLLSIQTNQFNQRRLCFYFHFVNYSHMMSKIQIFDDSRLELKRRLFASGRFYGYES